MPWTLNRDLVIGLILTLAAVVMLVITAQSIRGYGLQVLSAAVVVLLAFAAIVMLLRSLLRGG